MNNRLGYCYIFLAGSFWGTLGMFSKFLNQFNLPSSSISFLRLIMASAILFFILLFKDKSLFKIQKKDLNLIILSGLIGQALFNYSYSLSVISVGVSMSSILLYLSPIFVFIFSLFLFKEKIYIYKILGLIINVVGCFLVVTNGKFDIEIISLNIIFGIAASLFYASMTIISSYALKKMNPLTFLFYSMLSGSFFLLFNHSIEPLIYHFDFKILLISLLYGCIVTAIPYLLYYKGLTMIKEVSKVPVIASIEVVVSTFLGVWIFQEAMEIIQVLGVILVLSSIAIMNCKYT